MFHEQRGKIKRIDIYVVKGVDLIMGINENTKNMIDALAKNDTTLAKAYTNTIT